MKIDKDFYLPAYLDELHDYLNDNCLEEDEDDIWWEIDDDEPNTLIYRFDYYAYVDRWIKIHVDENKKITVTNNFLHGDMKISGYNIEDLADHIRYYVETLYYIENDPEYSSFEEYMNNR